MFRSARYIFVLLLVLAACAGSLFFCTDFREAVGGTGKYVPIFSGKQFTENELIQIELAFADAKLSDYVISDGTVQVPKRQKTVFLQALKKTDFLTQETAETQSSSGGLFVSEKEREAVALRDKQAALAAQIRTFHGIESARILLDVSETKVGFTREKHASAAVSIRSRAGYSVTQEDIQSILRLVTCSVCGLKPANVTIVDTRTNQSWRFDAPKIEILPESAVENGSPDSEPVSPNESRKVVLQSEPLPQPELWNSSSQEILQTSAVEPTFESSTNSRALGQIAFNGPSETSKTPEILSELVSSGNESTSIFSKSFGKLKLSEVKTSNQHPRQVVILLGILAAPVILICAWVIFVTRKGIFHSGAKQSVERKKCEEESMKRMNSDSPSASTADLMNDLVSEIVNEVSEEQEFRTEMELDSGTAPDSVSELDSESELVSESELDSNLRTESEFETGLEFKCEPEEETEPEESTEPKPRRVGLPEISALEQVAPERLAQAFLEERPQTAAMLLAQMNPTVTSEVLTFIPTKLRQGIESRMAGSGEPDEEILRDAAQAILEHLDELEQTSAEDDDFLETARTILKGRTTRKTETREKPMIRPLAEAIPKERIVNRFEDLKSCTDEELRGVLRGTSVQDVNLALLGAEPELVNRVLGILPKLAAKELQFQLTHPGKIRLMEVEEARQRMVEHAGA